MPGMPPDPLCDPPAHHGRRQLLQGLVLAVAGTRAWATGSRRASDALPPVGFLGYEVIDEQPEPGRAPALQTRAALIGRVTADELQARALCRLVDLAPAQAALKRLRDENEYLYRCNACLSDLPSVLGTPWLATGWVQRVSGLILNINLQLQDVAANRLLVTRSVDIRGDNDEAWLRGARYLVRQIAERPGDWPLGPR